MIMFKTQKKDIYIFQYKSNTKLHYIQEAHLNEIFISKCGCLFGTTSTLTLKFHLFVAVGTKATGYCGFSKTNVKDNWHYFVHTNYPWCLLGCFLKKQKKKRKRCSDLIFYDPVWTQRTEWSLDQWFPPQGW